MRTSVIALLFASSVLANVSGKKAGTVESEQLSSDVTQSESYDSQTAKNLKWLAPAEPTQVDGKKIHHKYACPFDCNPDYYYEDLKTAPVTTCKCRTLVEAVPSRSHGGPEGICDFFGLKRHEKPGRFFDNQDWRCNDKGCCKLIDDECDYTRRCKERRDSKRRHKEECKDRCPKKPRRAVICRSYTCCRGTPKHLTFQRFPCQKCELVDKCASFKLQDPYFTLQPENVYIVNAQCLCCRCHLPGFNRGAVKGPFVAVGARQRFHEGCEALKPARLSFTRSEPFALKSVMATTGTLRHAVVTITGYRHHKKPVCAKMDVFCCEPVIFILGNDFNEITKFTVSSRSHHCPAIKDFPVLTSAVICSK